MENVWKTLFYLRIILGTFLFHRNPQASTGPNEGKVENSTSNTYKQITYSITTHDQPVRNAVNEVALHRCESSAKIVNKLADQLVEIAILLCQSFDLLYRMHYGRMMFPAKLAADLRKAAFGQTLTQVHRHLPRNGDGPRIILGLQFFDRHPVVRGNGACDALYR